MATGGEGAIKVEPIARQMQVSKGSFYWHFKDLNGLKASMLAHWAKVATFEAIAQVEMEEDEGRARLFALIDLATGPQNKEYGGSSAEAAIRNWARFDKKAAGVVKKIELARLGFVAELFEQAGQSAERAQQNARLLYGAMIGLEQLPGANGVKTRKGLGLLLEKLL